MSQDIGIKWKIKVKVQDKEVEVVGTNYERTSEKFAELEKKYFSTWQKE